MKKRFVIILLLLISSFYGFKSSPIVDWVGNMFPGSGSSNTITEGSGLTIYVQVYKAGVTEPSGQGTGINCEIYYGEVPAFGQPWEAIYTQPMSYNVDIGNNDEYQGSISPPAGLYEFTCRCSDDGGASWKFASLSSGNGMLTVDVLVPLEMSSFNAEVSKNSVKLDWETSSEINNKYFEIERKVDSRSWESIGIIDGNGDAHEINKYHYIDKSPVQGINYYRLKQVDFDGEFSYSSVVNANVRTPDKCNIFPNPTKSTLVIQHSNMEAFTTELVTINGKKIKTFFLDKFSSEIDLSDIRKGIYILSIKNQNGYVIERHKIVKL